MHVTSDVEKFSIVLLLSYHLWLVHGHAASIAKKWSPLPPATWEFTDQWNFTKADSQKDGLGAKCITGVEKITNVMHTPSIFTSMYTDDYKLHLPTPLGEAGWLLALLQDTSSMPPPFQGPAQWLLHSGILLYCQPCSCKRSNKELCQYFALVNSDHLHSSVPEIVDQMLLTDSLSVYQIGIE